MAPRIGVDIGGTFTDLVYYDDDSESLIVEKVPTTPTSPEQGCISAIRNAVPDASLRRAAYFLHGTTVGLNALLEQRGATVGLLTTAGFRDILAIGRGSRGDPYNLLWAPRPALVPRRLRLTIRERTYANGQVVAAVAPEDVVTALEQLLTAGVTAIAVAFLNSYINPANELTTRDVLRRGGFSGAISLSHQVSGEYGEYERTSTTVIDAFVRARMSDYLSHIELELAKSGFRGQCLVTRSGSGSMSFREAQERPFETIMSGPVAGAEGASELSRTLGLGDLITADVGGTSFDTCVILDGKPQLQFHGEVGGMPLHAAWVDVRSIGAGGGSVGYVDAGGGLRVGPRSAGATPGPACYGRGGTEPCVTDAAFYLGMLGEGQLASGLQLDLPRATRALESVGNLLGYTPEQTARGIIQVVCANMANAIREITIEQGIDPRKMRLLAFGGAGPLLATQLARELSISEIIVPPYAGTFSAWGLLGANIVRSVSATRFLELHASSIDLIQAAADQLFRSLEERTERIGPEESGVKELSLDMRYQGQEHTLLVTLPVDERGRLQISVDQLSTAFRDSYFRTYRASLDRALEVVTVRATIRQALPRRGVHKAVSASSPLERRSSYVRAASFANNGRDEFVILDRNQIPPGKLHRGPAILHEATTTTYVDTDFDYKVTDNGCLWVIRVR